MDRNSLTDRNIEDQLINTAINLVNQVFIISDCNREMVHKGCVKKALKYASHFNELLLKMGAERGRIHE